MFERDLGTVVYPDGSQGRVVEWTSPDGIFGGVWVRVLIERWHPRRKLSPLFLATGRRKSS